MTIRPVVRDDRRRCFEVMVDVFVNESSKTFLKVAADVSSERRK